MSARWGHCITPRRPTACILRYRVSITFAWYWWVELTHNSTHRNTGAVVHHVARVQSLTIQTWMLCPSKPSVGSCSGAGVHGNAGTHIWTRQTHRLCHMETLDAPVVSIWTILDAQNYISEGGPHGCSNSVKHTLLFNNAQENLRK